MDARTQHSADSLPVPIIKLAHPTDLCYIYRPVAHPVDAWRQHNSADHSNALYSQGIQGLDARLATAWPYRDMFNDVRWQPPLFIAIQLFASVSVNYDVAFSLFAVVVRRTALPSTLDVFTIDALLALQQRPSLYSQRPLRPIRQECSANRPMRAHQILL